MKRRFFTPLGASGAMGGASSNLRKMLSEEAARVRGERKEGESADLTLGELLKYQVPGGFEEDVRVIHPAVMWVLDRDKKGAFADEDLHEFAQEMGVYTNAWMRVDWNDMIVAKCYMALHDAVLRPGPDPLMGDSDSDSDTPPEDPGDTSAGQPRDLESFQAWVARLVRRNEPVVTHPKHPGVEFVDVNTVHDVYVMFDVGNSSRVADYAMPGAGFQLVLDAMHRHAEDLGLQPLDEEDLDDYVPMEVIMEFVKEYVMGYGSINVHVWTH